MLDKYNNKKLNDIKKSFETSYEESIKILLCNIKIEDTISKFSSVIQSLKEDELEEIKLFSDIKNITNTDLSNFIEDNSFMKLQRNKCFVEIYEDFERALKDIVEYIHYKKPTLTFNKNNNDINGSMIISLLENEDALKNVIKMNIDKNVNKIIYNKNILEILDFISRYSKVKVDETSAKRIQLASKIRNIVVHNKGNISDKDLESIYKIYGKSNKKYSYVSIKSDILKSYLDLFTCIINDTCEGLENNL